VDRVVRVHPATPDPDPRRFAGVILVDRRGWILLQERDEHPRIDPEKWGLAGGHLDPGEDFEPAAHRELEEETGVGLPAGGLRLFREFVVDHREAYGTWDVMQVFVAPTELTDADIDCREGRQIVFVDPEVARGLDLSAAAVDIVPAFLASDLYATMAP
jgi:8-oxo-dGTP diphosphatase